MALTLISMSFENKSTTHQRVSFLGAPALARWSAGFLVGQRHFQNKTLNIIEAAKL